MTDDLTIKQKEVLGAAERYVATELRGDSGGHDWWHVHRVRKVALALAVEEGADRFIVELSALLHDIADFKLSGSLTAGREAAFAFCRKYKISEEQAEGVATIVHEVSFRGAGVSDMPLSLEGSCVRDADRLDALGAIGIGRTFAYGGKTGRPMWDPERKPTINATEAEYRNVSGSSMDHFYEKLLLLKDRMDTKAGRRLADRRHHFLKMFIEEFKSEWDGKT